MTDTPLCNHPKCLDERFLHHYFPNFWCVFKLDAYIKPNLLVVCLS
jgi:hypothetical protein